MSFSLCAVNAKKLRKYLINHPDYINKRHDLYHYELLLACKEGNIDILDTLLEFGGDVNYNMRSCLESTPLETTLYYCPKEQVMDVVFRLLNAKIPFDTRQLNMGSPYTPFMLCAKNHSDPHLLNYLYLHGGDPNIINAYGMNALMICCLSNSSDEMFTALLHITNNINQQSYNGNTVLHYAVSLMLNKTTHYQLILTRPDVDVTIKNDRGSLAQDLIPKS